MKIIFLSHTYYGSYFKVGSHHLAYQLKKQGHDVIHISTPLSLAKVHLSKANSLESGRRLNISGKVRVTDNILTYVPRCLFYPGFFFGIFSRESWVFFNSLTKADIVLIDQPLLFTLWFFRLRKHKGKFIYRPTDRVNRIDLRLFEYAILRNCDGVVATDEKCIRKLHRLTIPSMVMTNGVNLSDFVDLPHENRETNAVYIGALDARIDWDFLNGIAEEGNFSKIDLYGLGQVPSNCHPNIRYLGALDYSKLPATLARYRFGLLPFNENWRNASRSPMKVFEYLASGLIVLASDVMRKLDDESLPIFYPNERYKFDLSRILKLTNEIDERQFKSLLESQDWSKKAMALQDFFDKIQ